MTGADTTPTQLRGLADKALSALTRAQADREMVRSGVAARLRLRVTVLSDEAIANIERNATMLARQAISLGGATPSDFPGITYKGQDTPTGVFDHR